MARSQREQVSAHAYSSNALGRVAYPFPAHGWPALLDRTAGARHRWSRRRRLRRVVAGIRNAGSVRGFDRALASLAACGIKPGAGV